VRRIAISGLVALAAVLGGGAVQATAMAQTTAVVRPTTAVRPTSAVRPGSVAPSRTIRAAVAAAVGAGVTGGPLVSCVLTTDCLGAEGSSTLTAGTSTPTRVARWSGSSWKGVGVALPKGTRSDDLLGVSCRGAKSCLVVGDYYTSTSQSAASRVLALAYNGTSLKPTPAVPLPKGTMEAVLTGVSCVTTRYCVALGVADGGTPAFGEAGSLNLIERWNGATWALVHTAAGSIGSTTEVEPTVVSCATTASCVLAGEAFSLTSSSAATKIYVASWNGKKLTTMKPATVSGGGDGGYALATGASCATASNCAVTGVVVGDVSSNNLRLTAFTEIWNGKTWQLAKTTWPKGAADSFTFGVSCYAAHSCEAVGEYGASTTGKSPFDAAAVAFNGTAGTLQTVPAPSKGYSDAFASVSCLPWGRCVAIGDIGKTAATSFALMTGVWNGKAWKLDPGL
jgi:hypothetical protein